MMVALMLLAILFSSVYGILSTAETTQASTTANLTALSEAQLAIDTLTRQIRDAEVPGSQSNPVSVASAQAMTFYTNLGNPNGPSEVELKATSSGPVTSLEEGVIAPSAAQGYSGLPTWTTICPDLDATKPIFAYYPLGSDTPIPLPAASPAVGSIGISLWVRHSVQGTPVELRTRVTMRNVLLATNPGAATTTASTTATTTATTTSSGNTNQNQQTNQQTKN